MDTQTRVICRLEIGSRLEVLEKVIDTKKYHKGDLGNEFIEFTEYTKATIVFLSDDSNAKLEVETYGSEEYSILYPGEKIDLSPGGDSDNMLVPGYYTIKIISSNLQFEGLYKVNPSSIEWNGLMNIRKYLENMVKGLSYNIYAERCGNTRGEAKIKDIHTFEIYKYINSNWNLIVGGMEQICKNPIMDIYKEYDKRGYSKKPDSKSQRWLMKQGKTYGINNYDKCIYYEKHSKITENVIENKLVKGILEDIDYILGDLAIEYRKVEDDLKGKKVDLEFKRSDVQRQLEFSTNLFNVDKAKYAYNNEIKSISNSIKQYETTLGSINKYSSKIKAYRGVISHYKTETFFRDIENDNKSKIPSTKLLKNKNYNQIYSIYRNLRNMKIDGINKNMVPHRKTSKLYEIYNYILIKEVLEEIGFVWTEGWLKGVDNILSSNGDIQPGDTIILKKENYKVELIFDKEYRTSSSVLGSTESQLFASGNSRRPDITVLLYENNKFLRGLIAEVKCRRKKNIYRDDVQTDVMCQLEDYNNLKYYDGKKKRADRKNLAITKVIVLYPKQMGECKFKAGIYEFPFIQINPSNDGEEIYGYKELKEEIEEFIYDN